MQANGVGRIDAPPSNVTFVARVRPVPVMVTEVPTGPLGGASEVIVRFTLKLCRLVRVVESVVTVTDPVSASAGTVAVMNVVPVGTMVVAFVPPNFTTEELTLKTGRSTEVIACLSV